MSRKRNKGLIIFGAIVFLIGAFLIAAFLSGNRYACVREGIPLIEAVRIVDDARYFLISPKHGATDAEYSIIHGKYAGFDVNLIGSNTPGGALSNVFFLSKANIFLVEIGNEYNTENRGISFDDAYPKIYSVDVISWEIVIPIRRDYQYRVNGQKERLFSPSKYLDQFDVEQGDYIPD